jgi:hypothetical protein
MISQKVSFIRECVSCAHSTEIPEILEWINEKSVFLETLHPASRNLSVNLKLSHQYLKNNLVCQNCNSSSAFILKDIHVDNHPMYVLPDSKNYVVKLVITKVQNEIKAGFEPIYGGEIKPTKFTVKSFYDTTINMIQKIDEKMFVNKLAGKFHSILFYGPDSEYNTWLNDLYFHGFSKNELLQHLKAARQNYMVSSGIDKYEY